MGTISTIKDGADAAQSVDQAKSQQKNP